MAKIVGVTGGIGSGKTSLMKYAEEQGYIAYYSDLEAKKMYNKSEIINQLQNVFEGFDIWTNDILDKKKLANVVFTDEEKLMQLNNIIHPAVKQHFEEFVYQHQQEKLILKETALLFETGIYKSCDYSILITAPEEIRIARVMQRDNIDREEVVKRMKNQWKDEKKAKLADFVVQNITLEVAQIAFLDILKEIK
ncbi:MAG TPA: dephospho-CoA kinase [Flavobacterium sp.]|nr:dephospho-CoA kinase [Flavobacterium sp.]